jgi:hypothetical protein
VKPKLGSWVKGEHGHGVIVAMSIGWCVYHDVEEGIEYAEPWEQIGVLVDPPDAPDSVQLNGPDCPVVSKKEITASRCAGCGGAGGVLAASEPTILCANCRPVWNSPQ